MSSNEFLLSLELGGSSIKSFIIPLKSFKIFNFDKIIEHEDSKTFIVETRIDPIQTFHELANKINSFVKNHNGFIYKIGVGSFGPLCINPNDSKYGFITSTPKEGWNMFDLLTQISQLFNCDKKNIYLQTDVNACVQLEYKYGNHNKQSIAYITIGTGCGIGIINQGEIINGLSHTEGGHIFIRKFKNDDFQGVCKFHGDCAEGLITNIAIKERKNLKSIHELEDLSDDDPVWDTISYYISQVCLSLLYLCTVEKIIIGGGIINRSILLKKIRKYFQENNNGYISNNQLEDENINDYIVRTNFNNEAGLLAGLSLIKL